RNQYRYQWQTAVASMPTFTPTPRASAQPHGVWAFAKADCGTSDAYEGWGKVGFTSCWAGLGGGQIMGVRSMETDHLSDPLQGIISVFLGPYYLPNGYGGTSYDTPLKVGAVHIVSIDGSLARVASLDNQVTMIFDVATGQWVPPSTGRAAPLTTGLVECPPPFYHTGG